MIILRDKTFAEGEGSSTGKKLLKGALATTAVVGGGLLAGKKGFLGAGIQKGVNKGLLGVGTKMAGSGNKTIQSLGEKAISSGAKDYGQAVGKQAVNKAIAGGASKTSALRQGVVARTRATNAAQLAAINKL